MFYDYYQGQFPKLGFTSDVLIAVPQKRFPLMYKFLQVFKYKIS